MTIQTRADVLAYFHQLTDPLTKYRKEKNGRFYLGSSVAHYSQDQGEVEGFLRTLWGIGPMTAAGTYPQEDFEFYKEAIIHSTNPDEPAYFGKVEDYDQLIVEMASLAVTLIETKEIFWETLTKKEQQHLYDWLNQINEVGVWPNNWRFFRVLVNVAFKKLGQPVNETRLKDDLVLIDSMYLGDGWYKDGNERQMDYYIPWAFHYYGMLYAHYMKEDDPKRSAEFFKRAKLFAQDFKYWFAKNGAAVAFGRSLTYRFAQGAFFSACVFTNNEVLPWGEIKGILLQHLNYWSQLPIQKRDGVLSIGYAYENFYMAEGYNSPGSPYWAYKTFILLATPESHPFWQVPATWTEVKSHQKMAIPMILTNEEGENVQLYPVNQWTAQMHAADKYSKFVYSSLFGFSVLKGNLNIGEGSFDNTLAISEKGVRHFISKEEIVRGECAETYTWQQWQPYPDVTITSYVVPLGPWHVRIHEVKTKRVLEVYDGGFSHPVYDKHAQHYQMKTFENGLSYEENQLAIASVPLKNYQKVVPIFTEPNTNLLFPHSFYFGLYQELPVGKQTLISAHYGSLKAPQKELPEVLETAESYEVKWRNQYVTVLKVK